MFLSLAILVPYAIAFLCFIAQISEAKYPVAILDNEQKFSPRLYGVSTIVYNNEMYAYGGQTALAFLVSNKMYKFSFDIEKKNVSMETVDQATPGPNCTSCGSVLINKTQMLVLTHEHASRNDTETAQQVVKPYTFDFVTKAWSEPVPANLPRYNELQKHVFVMRRRHKTILGKDGCVYVIGGTNFFNSTYMQESWYYDPSKNEYGVLSDNRNRTTRMHSSLVNLP
jgi:hypothetical protein